MNDGAFDPFVVLGVPRCFRLDRGLVQAAYLRITSSEHPDRQSSGVGRSASSGGEVHLAEINRAKQMLDDPEQRGNALFELLVRETGIVLSSAETRELPDGFLQEVMMIREDMEAASSSENAERTRELHEWAERRREKHRRSVASLFDKPGMDLARAKAIRRELNAWRYIERMQEQMDA